MLEACTKLMQEVVLLVLLGAMSGRNTILPPCSAFSVCAMYCVMTSHRKKLPPGGLFSGGFICCDGCNEAAMGALEAEVGVF